MKTQKSFIVCGHTGNDGVLDCGNFPGINDDPETWACDDHPDCGTVTLRGDPGSPTNI